MRDPVAGASETVETLWWLHKPTVIALFSGMAGGAYLAWQLLSDKGSVALILGLFAGIFLGGGIGVATYWLFRFFRAMGD